MSDALAPRRSVALGIWLIIAGALGFFAAFQLIIEKFNAYAHPNDKLGCDFNIVLQCTKNLDSWQGSLFGFPNPIIGAAAWPIVIVVGVALIAGIQFPQWFWIVFNVFVVLAMAFVIFLITQSIFVLGTLCIYCMLTWLVTIPTFWIVTLRSARLYGRGGLRRVASAASTWVPIISLASYVVIAVLAQVRLDVIAYL